MGELEPSTANARSTGDIPVHRPRWGFWKGLLTGVAIEIPVLAATVWVLGRLGVGDPDAEFMHIMRLTAVFAGVAALFTAGGIGRLAAHTFVDGGRRRAVYRAARAHAAASAGLVLIAAIPHGHLPGHEYTWLAFPAAGVVSGAACGSLIGLVCSGQTSLGLGEVWSLARRPSVALRNLLDPEDLVRLGSALRTRTTNLIEGIFEPAPPPPKTPEPPPAGDPAAPADATTRGRKDA
jgi:hypothetical protein